MEESTAALFAGESVREGGGDFGINASYSLREARSLSLSEVELRAASGGKVSVEQVARIEKKS